MKRIVRAVIIVCLLLASTSSVSAHDFNGFTTDCFDETVTISDSGISFKLPKAWTAEKEGNTYYYYFDTTTISYFYSEDDSFTVTKEALQEIFLDDRDENNELYPQEKIISLVSSEHDGYTAWLYGSRIDYGNNFYWDTYLTLIDITGNDQWLVFMMSELENNDYYKSKSMLIDYLRITNSVEYSSSTSNGSANTQNISANEAETVTYAFEFDNFLCGNDMIRIYYADIQEKYDGTEVCFYIENFSDRQLKVTAEAAVLNGIFYDNCIMSEHILPGTTAYSSCTIKDLYGCSLGKKDELLNSTRNNTGKQSKESYGMCI